MNINYKALREKMLQISLDYLVANKANDNPAFDIVHKVFSLALLCDADTEEGKIKLFNLLRALYSIEDNAFASRVLYSLIDIRTQNHIDNYDYSSTIFELTATEDKDHWRNHLKIIKASRSEEEKICRAGVFGELEFFYRKCVLQMMHNTIRELAPPAVEKSVEKSVEKDIKAISIWLTRERKKTGWGWFSPIETRNTLFKDAFLVSDLFKENLKPEFSFPKLLDSIYDVASAYKIDKITVKIKEHRETYLASETLILKLLDIIYNQTDTRYSEDFKEDLAGAIVKANIFTDSYVNKYLTSLSTEAVKAFLNDFAASSLAAIKSKTHDVAVKQTAK